MASDLPGLTRSLAIASNRCEARQSAATFTRFEDNLHLLANAHLRGFEIDDIRHHGHALLQRHVGNDIGGPGRVHDRVGVYLASASRLLPLEVGRHAVRTDAVGIVVRLLAILAPLEHQLFGLGAFPIGLGTGRRQNRRVDLLAHYRYSRSRMTVEPTWRVASEPPVACASTMSWFLTWTFGWASPRACRTASMTLVIPPRLPGWFEQSPPPSVLKGSLPTPEIRLPSATNRPPAPFSQKPRSSI